jgi:ABC-2 type transport system ATP-binding protein
MRRLFLALKAKGKTILLASHSKEDVELLCDTVIRMDRGRIIESTPPA